jgi:hypothetical protein
MLTVIVSVRSSAISVRNQRPEFPVTPQAVS